MLEKIFLTRAVKSQITCPRCRAEIPLEDVNVATDIALCRQCGQTWSYATLLTDCKAAALDVRTPPRGAWFRELSPNGFEAGISTRSASAFLLVPFFCIWSVLSLDGIYGTQIAKREFDPVTFLFGIPFVIGTVILGCVVVMSICGEIIVTVREDSGVVFTGVGPIGWRQRFDWRKVSAIRRTERIGRRGSVSQQITLEGEKRLDFASGVKNERLDFLLFALRKKWRESSR